jgi:hypothetical protein
MRLWGRALFFVVVFASTQANAQEPSVTSQDTAVTKQACLDAYRDVQPLVRNGSFSKARPLLLLCARDPCPKALQGDCAEWLDQVTQRTPSVVVALRGADGVDIPEAQLSIDGAVISPRLDGREIEIDPGEHVISVQQPEHEPLTETIIAREHERGRKVTFDLGPPPGQTPVPLERPLPWTFWTATGVAGAGLATFGAFGVVGLSERSDLESCKPFCSDHRLQPTRTDFLVADIALAVTVVAAGVATYFYFTRPSVPADAARFGKWSF